ncbi:hypothetical protein BX600DRAFT_443316 [Xylariales sp. PMI_506]|nr:hypothetical protein BX600DRAFT_443316 [Xylariales sp. PMI_506]
MGSAFPEGMKSEAGLDRLGIKTSAYFYKPLGLHKKEKPYLYDFNVKLLPVGKRRTNVEFEQHPIMVYDIRDLEEQTFTLEQQGFEIINHESFLNIQQLTTTEDIETYYISECCEIVSRRFNGAETISFGWTHRQNGKTTSDTNKLPGALRPVNSVHIDHSTTSMFDRLVDHFGQTRAEKIRESKRCLIINFWRPLCTIVEEWPLVYCDINTVQQSDCIARDFVKSEYTAEGYVVRYNPNHKYYYLSEQRFNEVILLKMAETNPARPNNVYQGSLSSWPVITS